ncbi:alpha-1,3-mannosyl-glycoprotein 4-beta-N-acetylglucosaminyltransferase-like protein MGAT4E [Urocitellus parryii]
MLKGGVCFAFVDAQETSSSRKTPRPLEDWQTITFKYLEKIQRRRKTWLTVGLSSASQWTPNGLLYTLVSLYQASSPEEEKHLTVLVHLADSDLLWLKETIAQISRLFSPQILAGQLLLIHAPSDVYPSVNGTRNEASREELYSKQNVDHAFLVSFATNLSTYFLLIEDNVFCSPNFVTQIHSQVATMKSSPWVILEFSDIGFLGKLFHSKDLPLLAHFLLLFHQEKPLDKLLLHFRTLMVQEKSIICRPFLFYYRMSHPTFDDNQKATLDRETDPFGPDNPPAAVFTDMTVSNVHFPWEAYTLDESYFWTHDVNAGDHLTVILNHPSNLTKVQVMTGSIMEGKYALRKGQVELGYDPEGMPQYCASFFVLGHLVEGQLSQEIVPKSMGHQVNCVRLVAKAKQDGGLMIRHIYLWEEKAKKEKHNQRYDKSLYNGV